MKKKFHKFNTCQIVKGFSRGCIYDFQRGQMYTVPLELIYYLEDITMAFKNTKLEFESSEIKEYHDFLISKEIIFEADKSDIDNLDCIGFIFEEAYKLKISNMVIYVSHKTNNYIFKFYDFVLSFGVNAICFIFTEQDINIVKSVLDIFSNDDLVFLTNIEVWSQNTLENSSFNKFPKLNRIIYYNQKFELFEYHNNKTIIIHSTIPKINYNCCGENNIEYFSFNKEFYDLSLSSNSCLGGKISIDAEGNIKNCPSMKESFGNVADTTLVEAIEKQGFKKYWNINKDLIAVCKDCEFRYLCTDCRAYVEDPQDTSGPEGTNLSKPLKCGYNPYKGEWSEWSTNTLNQNAIEFYDLKKSNE